MHHRHIKTQSQWMSQIWLQMWLNNACGYYKNVYKCIVAYLLIHTHQKQSKFNWLINAPWAYKITVSMNVSDMFENDLKRCMWMLRTCLQMHIVAYLLNYTHQSKFNWLINAPWAYKINVSMNVPDMVANGLIQCVWILRACLQMHSCIPLKSHPLEQI